MTKDRGAGRLHKVCDNASSNGNGIIGQQCWKNAATRHVTIKYNAVETSVHDVCDACAGVLVRDARKYGYTVTTTNL